ncbi:unnamed protein product [Owenia fusiformis]|uniref:TFIID subunit TAF5 NTD2 domain-containing protein n=1 Tax=Owenia fusiformis TaxID=6347 RepID=A0A8S4N3C1_OWEFU|nr:unnamed protein product [Owenia fusiformis]
MKRIKSDQLNGCFSDYVKRRVYSDEPAQSKKSKEGQNTMSKMTLRRSTQKDTGVGEVLSFSSISGDTTSFDLQYTKIKKFILESPEPMQSDLKEILYPLFVHVYLELLCNGHKTPAHKFYSRHHLYFKEQNEYSSVLEALSNMFNKEDVIADKDINSMRENKYCLQVPMATIEYLLRYIKNGDNMLLLQLFNKHIHLGANLKSSMNLDLKADKEGKGGTLPSPPENKVIHNEEMLSALKKSIKTIRDGPPCLTSICLYSFLNAYQGMCSSCISNNNKYLCAGFEDAAIRMWSLTPDPIPSQAVTDNVATVHLSGDYIEDIIDRNRPPELGEQKVMRGHAGTVYKVTFTPDSNYILSAGEDTTVRLWDLSTHTNTVAYKGHTFPVWDVDASPQGTLFVSGSHDRTAKLWSTDRIYPIRTYAGHSLDVDCVKFHPNNNYIATGSCDKSVRMWSVQDAKAVRLFQGHRGTVFTVAFSPNGRYLASAGEDRRVKVWDLGSGKLMKDLRGHSDTVYALCFNNESTLLSSGGHDGVLRVWDVQKTVEHSGNQSEGHSPELLASYPVKSTTINYVQYLPNSLLLAVGNLS